MTSASKNSAQPGGSVQKARRRRYLCLACGFEEGETQYYLTHRKAHDAWLARQLAQLNAARRQRGRGPVQLDLARLECATWEQY